MSRILSFFGPKGPGTAIIVFLAATVTAYLIGKKSPKPLYKR
jgi:hypothetical protein